MNKWFEWSKYVEKYLRKPNLRRGQSFMLALSDIDKQLYNSIIDTEFDCFYADERCEVFIEKLQEAWKE